MVRVQLGEAPHSSSPARGARDLTVRDPTVRTITTRLIAVLGLSLAISLVAFLAWGLSQPPGAARAFDDPWCDVYPEDCYTPEPTATHTATAVPTPAPTGSLRASRSSILVGQYVTVSAYNVNSSAAPTSFDIAGPVSASGQCPTGVSGEQAQADERREVSGAGSTVLLLGCSKGTATVWLMSRTGIDLDEISISVKKPTPTPDYTATAEAEKTAVAETATAVARITATAQARETATAVAKVTATARARETATAVAKVTATAQARETATAVAKVTATAQARETATAVAKVTATARARETATAVAKVTATAQARETATAVAMVTATAQARETATAVAKVTATAQARETATAVAKVTATAQANSTPTPTPIASGHQADHTVNVVRGAMPPVAAPPGMPNPNQIIPASIIVAVNDWNAKMRPLNKDLSFCFASSTCPANTDGYDATVKTVKAEKNPDPPDHGTNTDCGKLSACNKFYNEQATGHIREMTIIIENPAWRFNNKVHTNVFWTDSKPLDNTYEGKKCNTDSTQCWSYISATMAHELGHSMGLPDFDEYASLAGITAIMNPVHDPRALSVTSGDIEEMRRIYDGHTRH